MEKQYFKVTFGWYDTDTYCSNLCIAENEEQVRKHYAKHHDVSVRPAQDWEIREAKAKGMPVTEAVSEKEAVRSILQSLMNKAMSDDYSAFVAEALLDDVAGDVKECADPAEWNDDDVRLAVGRVLCRRLGIPT